MSDEDIKVEEIEKVKLYNSRDKWIVAAIAGLLFLLISSPFLYSYTSKLAAMAGVTMTSECSDGAASWCPNYLGLIIHTVIFVLLVRALIM